MPKINLIHEDVSLTCMPKQRSI